jgi:hypothetical protein
VPEPVGAKKQEPTTDVPVPISLVKKLAALLADHRDGTERVKKKAHYLFVGLRKGEPGDEKYLIPIINQWLAVCRWFMARTHVNSTPDRDVITSEFMESFEVFEHLLGSFADDFFSGIEEIDDILEEANT